jgi:APA family basic amino acid/polyamine antiporter
MASYSIRPEISEQWHPRSFDPCFATKSVEQLVSHSEGEHRMKRVLGAADLVALGIGAIIGSGIFVITGAAAAAHAGPAVVVSFLIAGAVAVFAALCYSRLFPVSTNGAD